MQSDDKSVLITKIKKALIKRGVNGDALVKICATLDTASIRPLRVLFECCDKGEVSTETLTKTYGYNQPPRAARDLRELGFNLSTKFSKTTDGRRMAVYHFEDLNTFNQKGGRKAFTKREKSELVEKFGECCFYCAGRFSSNELQIDHRIPFEVVGNSKHEELGTDALILVCSSCNRSKSWSCEHCSNFLEKKLGACESCYWYNPDSYQHVGNRKALLINVNISGSDPAYKRLRGLTRDQIKEFITNNC